jgi:filamentous hemagglutinin family protein
VITSCLQGTLFFFLGLPDNLEVKAQVIPDGTTPETSITGDCSISCSITGGSIRSGNLFHSFETFNIGNRASINFQDSGSESIFTRVTGNSISTINGFLRIAGDANFFLINPNGISFGEGASIFLGGSFIATTADAVQFGSQGIMPSHRTDISTLLTVAPSALLFNQLSGQKNGNSTAGLISLTAGASINAGFPLVPNFLPGPRSLILAGRGITVNQSSLTAFSGNVDLIGIADGVLTIQAEANQFISDISDVSSYADVELSQNANVSVSNSFGGSPGAILIGANNLRIRNNSVLNALVLQNSQNASPQDSLPASNINLSVLGDFTLENSRVTSSTFSPVGSAGNITIKARTVNLIDGLISSASQGQGVGVGRITIDADSLSLSNNSLLRARVGPNGWSGSIDLNIDDRTLVDGSTIDISTTSDNTEPGTEPRLRLNTGEFQLLNQSIVGSQTSGMQNGGNIQITTRYGPVVLRDSVFRAFTATGNNRDTEKLEGNAGNIQFNVANEFDLADSVIEAYTSTEGNGGTIQITAPSVTISGAIPNVATTSTGSAGLFATSLERADGRGGEIRIQSPQLRLSQGGTISAASASSVEAGGAGSRAGGITVDGRVLTVEDGAAISASSTSGQGGDVILRGLDSVTVSNGEITATTETGQGGSVTINDPANPANIVQVRGPNGLISAAATDDQGTAGNIDINTRLLIVEDGGQIVATTTSGTGGDIALQGIETLAVSDGQIAASTGSGTAGNLTVNAPDAPAQSVILRGFLMNNQGQLLADASGQPIQATLAVQATAGGRAGNLQVNTVQLAVEDGAGISVSSEVGRAGNLEISAESILLKNGTLSAVTGVTLPGESGANIFLSDVLLLRMSDGSLISASALAAANGGNVAIDAADGYVIATLNQNNDITANAIEGTGGNINITTLGLYNFEQGVALPGNGTNDIDASSEFGQSGTVTINDPTTDPSKATTELPETVLDVRNLIDRSCATDAGPGRNSFVVTGRGGLPPAPEEIVRSDNAGLVDFGTAAATANASNTIAGSLPETTPSSPPEIVQAQTWYRDASGYPVLTAQLPEGQGGFSWPMQDLCDRNQR